MKRVFIFVLCVGLGAFGAYGITRWAACNTVLHCEDQVAWLQREFHLSAEETAAIKTLHDGYQPVCREHCAQIHRARSGLAALKAGAPLAETNAAQAELTRVETICREATRAHLERVAAVMAPAEGARFLALVLPKLSRSNHDGPFGLK